MQDEVHDKKVCDRSFLLGLFDDSALFFEIVSFLFSKEPSNDCTEDKKIRFHKLTSNHILYIQSSLRIKGP